jgi:hypothetical protein
MITALGILIVTLQEEMGEANHHRSTSVACLQARSHDWQGDFCSDRGVAEGPVWVVTKIPDMLMCWLRTRMSCHVLMQLMSNRIHVESDLQWRILDFGRFQGLPEDIKSRRNH